jgi:hypothetical protein
VRNGEYQVKNAITAFLLFALTALAACASDDYAAGDPQSGHHKNSRQRAFEKNGR